MKTTKLLLRRSYVNASEACRPQWELASVPDAAPEAPKPTASTAVLSAAVSRRGYYKLPLEVAESRFAISTLTTESYLQSYSPLQLTPSSKPPVPAPESGAPAPECGTAPTVHQRSALISQHPAMMRQSAALRRNLLNSLTSSE